MANTPLFHKTPMIRSTPIAPLHPDGFATLSDGLPVLGQFSTMMADDYGILPKPAPRQVSAFIELVKSAPHSRALNKQQLQRQRELRDEVYPLKLVRALERVPDDESPFVSERKSVFQVVHINSSTGNGRTVENVSTYSTAQAANDRALDFWDQKYGADMFTKATPNPQPDEMSIKKFEHIEESARHIHRPSLRKMTAYRSTGGIPANKSHWAINNKCLSLSQTSDAGERKVNVTILHVREQGIHV
ncbi:hypothetical protein F5Y12DRAFT_758108 [Xylaria sp. FL1777]|nr:hypothetical protein F5Y12DRAFT_758108 [Xylaria sp. FL1777]